jgi:hypothetical protein
LFLAPKATNVRAPRTSTEARISEDPLNEGNMEQQRDSFEQEHRVQTGISIDQSKPPHNETRTTDPVNDGETNDNPHMQGNEGTGYLVI